MEKKNEREELPDILKGFAIILVVLGHCIQEGSGARYREGQLYFSDVLYQFIYSFHMPLFMIVSGYLNWKGIHESREKYKRTKLLKKRASSLLIPIFLWTGLDYIRILLCNYFGNKPQPEAFVLVYFYNALNNLWFLWAVWWSFLAVYVMHNFLKDNIVVYILGFMAMFVIPDGLGVGAYKYMFPYFLFGYYMHDYMCHKRWRLENKPKLWTTVLLGLVFVGLFMFYNEDAFIYLTGYKIIGKQVKKQILIDLYRFVIGLVGSLFFVSIWQHIVVFVQCVNEAGKIKIDFKWIRRLGVDSMGIYILSGYLLIFWIQRLDFIVHSSYILNVLEMIVVLAVSWIVTLLLKRIPILKRLVGG